MLLKVVKVVEKEKGNIIIKEVENQLLIFTRQVIDNEWRVSRNDCGKHYSKNSGMGTKSLPMHLASCLECPQEDSNKMRHLISRKSMKPLLIRTA